ncbi:MAG: hypothetical protein M3N98_08750 [Actinomycetota bacterium]|nr:hypothetical protein [Actinomycetota bacterium]
MAFAFGVVELALQAGQLGGEEFVVRNGLTGDDGGLTDGEQVGSEHGLSDLVEHEDIEFVRPDLAFPAAPIGSSGLELIVVGAAVIVVVATSAGRRPGTATLDSARAAHHQAS